MKKEFSEAEMKIVYLESVDIICGSGCTNPVYSQGTDETQEMFGGIGD